jgi:hypothetical protein
MARLSLAIVVINENKGGFSFLSLMHGIKQQVCFGILEMKCGRVGSRYISLSMEEHAPGY